MIKLRACCPNCGQKLSVRHVTAGAAVRANASKQLTVREIARDAGVSVTTTRGILHAWDLPYKKARDEHPDGSTYESVKRHAAPERTMVEVAKLAGTTYMAARGHILRKQLPYKPATPGPQPVMQ